ncbi:MAG: rRNA maturation RNase YbeY [Phycisphaerales bacterium]
MAQTDSQNRTPRTTRLDIAVQAESGVLSRLGLVERETLDAVASGVRDAALRIESSGVGAPRFGRVSVRVVGDPTMRALHGRHCGDHTTTDVLTFPQMEQEAGDGTVDVDIAVCADEAARHAATRGHGVDRELLLYVVHGLLHCAGHDDHDDAAYEAMHAEEDRILEAIGVGATFAAAPGAERGAEAHRDEPTAAMERRGGEHRP